MKFQSENSGAKPTFISAKELADRWQCARSSVDRIARREKFRRICLGDGKNGMVRFLRKEVEAYEQNRII
jgi:predicted DNA-binding transcriptional regulator AlpA